jgi:hypothetical protein
VHTEDSSSPTADVERVVDCGSVTPGECSVGETGRSEHREAAYARVTHRGERRGGTRRVHRGGPAHRSAAERREHGVGSDDTIAKLGVPERVRPPGQLVEESSGCGADRIRLAEYPMLVEPFARPVEAHRFADGDRLKFGEHDMKLLHRAKPAGQAAVADEADRFGLPFPAHRIDRGLQRSGVAVVVLGRGCTGEVTMTNASAAPIREVKFALGIGVLARSMTSALRSSRCWPDRRTSRLRRGRTGLPEHCPRSPRAQTWLYWVHGARLQPKLLLRSS